MKTTEDFARDAGIRVYPSMFTGMNIVDHEGGNMWPLLERFAALVRAQALEDAARVCDAEFWNATRRDGEAAGVAAGKCAEAIRALMPAKA